MKSYTIHEASRKLTTNPTTLKNWEKELKGIVMIPRTKNGTRFYTEKEIELLSEVKNLYLEKRNKEEVKKTLHTIIQKKAQPPLKVTDQSNKQHLKIVEKNTSTKSATNENDIIQQNMRVLFSSLETYKQELLQEVKGEIRHEIKKELVDNVVKEIRIGNVATVNKVKEEMQKSMQQTSEGLEHLADEVHNSTKQTNSSYTVLQTNIKRLTQVSKAERKTYSKQWTANNTSSKEIKSMIVQLSKSSEEINKTMDQLHQNDQYLMETFELEREQRMQEIQQREKNFQDLVNTFRQTASAEEKKKKWWKIW